MTLQTSDMGNVEVKLSQNSNVMKDSHYIEVVGKVDEQGESLREFTCVDLGDSLGEFVGIEVATIVPLLIEASYHRLELGRTLHSIATSLSTTLLRWHKLKVSDKLYYCTTHYN